jgi:ribose 5-phosphate isomerase B
MKKAIIEKFSDIEFVNVGTDEKQSVDYPDFAEKVAKMVVNKEVDLGILICGTGTGMAIAANKVKGTRAAMCFNEMMAEFARKHNDANVLTMGARVIGEELAFYITEKFINTKFEGGRHERRVNKIKKLEEN